MKFGLKFINTLMISYNYNLSQIFSILMLVQNISHCKFFYRLKKQKNIFLFFLHREEILELFDDFFPFLLFFLYNIFLISIIFHILMSLVRYERKTRILLGKISKNETIILSNIIEIVASSPRIFISFSPFPPFSSLLPYRFVSLSSPALLPFVLLPRCCVSTRRSFPFFTPASFLFYRFHRFLPAFPFSTHTHPCSTSRSFLPFPPSRSSSSFSPTLSLPFFFFLSERSTSRLSSR